MYQQIINLEEETFKVLANRKRLEILQLLKNGLVKVSRQGQKAYYSLADNKITKAVEMIYQFLQHQHGFSDEFPAKILFPIVKDVVCGMRMSASEVFDTIKYAGR